jgi:hypothetical protein
VTTTDRIALAALIVSVVTIIISVATFAFTIHWSRKSDAEKWRRDAVTGSLSRVIANSTWLAEVGRDAFEKLQNTESNAPIGDITLRTESDRYRYGLAIERSLFDVYYSQNAPVRVALTNLFEAHRTIRRAVFNTESTKRHAAWQEISRWGVKPPAVQVVNTVTALHDQLLWAIQADLKIELSS